MFQSILKQKATSSNKLLVGNPEGSVAVVTLWSKARDVAERLEASKYCVLGQLFSAERGLDLLLRNIIANPQITNIVITGVDYSKSGLVLEDFFKKGFEKSQTRLTKKEVWKVKSEYEGYIDLDIPAEVLEELRASVAVTRTNDVQNLDFSALPKPERTREKRIYEKIEEEVKKYVGDYSGYVIRGKTIAEAWLKILDTILKFGKESETHYDEAQREVINLISVIEEENPKNFYLPEYLPCNKERVEAYIPRITRDLPSASEKSYTYGSRMRSWFGSDQVKRATDKLVRQPISRAVVINLYDSTKDLEVGGSPCLNHIWLRISDDKLYMTCIFRSQDMFEGYPENCFGLRSLQEEIRADLQQRLGREVDLAELIILSQSAHLYKDTWEWAKKVTEFQLPQYMRHMARQDPKGNFIISRENGEIVLDHTGPGGEPIGRFKGKTGVELRDTLTRENVISLVPHAFDLGLEVMKAEIANRLGLEYTQDQDIVLERPVAVKNNTERIEAPVSQEPIKSSVRSVIKDGILQPDHQKKLYPKVLDDAGISSIGL